MTNVLLAFVVDEHIEGVLFTHVDVTDPGGGRVSCPELAPVFVQDDVVRIVFALGLVLEGAQRLARYEAAGGRAQSPVFEAEGHGQDLVEIGRDHPAFVVEAVRRRGIRGDAKDVRREQDDLVADRVVADGPVSARPTSPARCHRHRQRQHQLERSHIMRFIERARK